MQKIKIEEPKKIENLNNLILFDRPSQIYISLATNYLPLIKKGDYVYQEEKIAIRKKDHFPLFSTISGIVTNIDAKGITIKNDFKNRVRIEEIKEYDLKEYSQEEISKHLFELGIQNIGDPDTEPYQKLKPHQIYKTLIINALQKEPYISLESFELKMERKQLLEIIEVFIDTYNFMEVYIVVPNNQKLLLEEWEQCEKDHKIKLIEMEEYYALGHNRKLLAELKGMYYQKDPIEKGTVILNVSTLCSIYQALKYRRPQIKMLVQFTGDMWKKNSYIEVRIGTYLKEILEQLEFKRTKEILLLQGGLLQGEPQNPDHTIISVNTKTFSAWKNIKENKPTSCTRCGKCIESCPMHLNPVLIMDALSKQKKIKRFHLEQCIDCKLCSFVCPSMIPLHDFIKEGKEKNQ